MTELLNEALDISVPGIFIGQLASNDSLLDFCSLAQISDGQMSTIQHAVSLVVKSLAMGAFFHLSFLGRMKGALVAFVTTMSDPIEHDENPACSSPV
jgi:hypothetical protein